MEVGGGGGGGGGGGYSQNTGVLVIQVLSNDGLV